LNSVHYSDITLVVEEQEIYAHKLILCARSPYFKSLLLGGLKETGKIKSK